MAFRSVVLLLITLLAAAAGSGVALSIDQTSDEQLRIQQQKRKQLQQDIAALRASIRQTREEKDSLSNELAEAERAVSALVTELRKLEGERQGLQVKLQGLQLQQDGLQQHISTARAQLAPLLRSAYIAGRQGRLKLLLNQEDLSLLGRLLAYHDYVSRAYARKLQSLQQDLQELDRVAQEIMHQQTELDRLRVEQQARQQQLQAQQLQRRQLLARMNARLSRQQDKLKRWEEDERQLKELLGSLQDVLKDLDLPEQKGFRESRGKLPWPVDGRLRQRFGSRKIGNLSWDGVIIGSKQGEEVRSIHSGRIAWADWLRGYGLLLIVDHGDGFMSLYGHNQSLFKVTGDWVEAGEVIATSGELDSGQAGTYFGIRHQGKPLNPSRWCRKRGRR